MKRYILKIIFKGYSTTDIVEEFKTFKEASLYAEVIDETVLKAFIKDSVNGKITIII